MHTLDNGRHALHVALTALEPASLGRSVKVAQASRKITPLASPVKREKPRFAVKEE